MDCPLCNSQQPSQPPLALAVPLSRFTPRVGGGSAFFVRRLFTVMKIFRTLAVALMLVIVSGCTSPELTPIATSLQIQQAEAVKDGRSLWELGKLDEAEASFQRALAINTNNVEAAYFLPLVHREQVDHRRPAIFSYHKTVVTNYQRMPVEQRTLASFGHFDSSTTVEDVWNRVGPPDLDIGISGIHSISYSLPPPDTNGIQITSPGGSFISGVTHGKTVLYERGTNDW